VLRGSVKNVCSVVATNDLRLMRDYALSVVTEWVELRIDYVLSSEDALVSTQSVINGVKELVRELRSTGKEVIITLRSRSEGGRFYGGEELRKYLMIKLASSEPTLIDVEARSKVFRSVTSVLKELGIDFIASIHYLSRVPTEEELLKEAFKAFSNGAKLFKAVYPARELRDNLVALNLCSLMSGKSVIMCSGSLGRVSRVLAPLAGAPFTYVYVGKEPVAPGQLSLNELLKAWESLGVISDG